VKAKDLEIAEDKDEGLCKFTVKGRINADNADALLVRLESVQKEGKTDIVMNMSQIEYLSSVGIRVILNTYKKALEAGSKFTIERPSQIVKNVLGMVALSEMMTN